MGAVILWDSGCCAAVVLRFPPQRGDRPAAPPAPASPQPPRPVPAAALAGIETGRLASARRIPGQGDQHKLALLSILFKLDNFAA